jgi:hypothetical protein
MEFALVKPAQFEIGNPGKGYQQTKDQYDQQKVF